MNVNDPRRPATTDDHDADRRSLVALAVLVAALAVANISRSALVPGRWHFAFNLGIGLVAVAIAVFAGLDRSEMGLDRSRYPAGLRLGGIAFAVTSLVVIAAALTGAVNDDSTDVTFRGMLLRALVVIPLATVVVEEVAFRGTLHGLLRRVTSPRWTAVAGAVLFGLWHVFPTWRGGAAGDVEVNRELAAAGTFAATTAAGFVFVWLRTRSDSLIAPVMLHLATNSVTFAAFWFVG